MPAVRTHFLKNNFSAGETSPLLRGRTDFAGYPHAAGLLENWIVLLQGGIETRPGLHYAWTVKTPARQTRLLPFEFSVTQAYIIEAGHEYFRFGRDGARLLSGATPVEIATPYQESELFALRTAQSNDIVTIVHAAHAPARLTRFSDTSWSRSAVPFRPPPSVERGLHPALTLTLSALTGTGITATASGPIWLSADVNRQITSGLGRAVIRSVTSTTVATVDIFEPFEASPLASGAWTLDGSPVANLTPSGIGPVGSLMTLTLSPSTLTELVTNGTFSLTTGWTDLDTGTGNSTISGGVCRLDAGAGAGKAWREQHVTGLTAGLDYTVLFDIAAFPIAVQVGTASGLADIVPATYNAVGTDVSVTFTPAATDVYLSFYSDLAPGSTFAATLDNVRMRLSTIAGWRAADADGTHYVKVAGGIVRLTAYASGTQVSGEVMKELRNALEVLAGAWTLEDVAWSATLGYPTGVGLSEQRMWYVRGQTVWGSVTGDYSNFAAGDEADDAVEYTIASPSLNPIHWLLSPRALLVGTAAEVARFAGVSGGPVTPSSVQVLSEDSVGAANVQPVRIGNTMLFVQREHVGVLELVYNGTGDTYIPDEVSKLAEHLFLGTEIVELAYEPRPPTLLWLVRSDGVALSCTYSNKEKIAAFSRITTGGQIESMARVPARGGRGSQVSCVVQRTLNGVATRTVEWFDPAMTVDCGLTYNGPAVSALTGLNHLAGELVQIVGQGGMVYPPQVVTAGGEVTDLVPAVTSAQVGKLFVCTAELLEPEPLTDGSPRSTTHVQKRYADIALRVHETQGLTVNGEALTYRLPGMLMDVAVPPFTGKKGVTNFGWDRAALLRIVQEQPVKATVLALTGVLLTGD